MPTSSVIARRDLLRAGTLAAAGLTFPLGASAGLPSRRSCIFLVLTGGVSHLDTWDMKPDSPREVRGPFKPIRTNVPGIEISEIFPRTARHADKFAIVRGVYHNVRPMHPEPPNFGVELHPDSAHSFGENCRRARELAETGVPFVTVHMFRTIYSENTWDCHGYKPFSTIRDYRDTVGPIFDNAFSALISDLHDRGLLETTMVVAMGEFGRTPRINSAGGRDHWTQCSSMLIAGGGVPRAQVIGSSDAMGAYPKDRPVDAARITAAIVEGSEAIRKLFA